MSDAPVPAVGRVTAAARCTSGRDFIAMLEAYRSSGGTVPGDVLGQLLKDHRRGDSISLAGLIAGGDVFAFEWRGNFWVPMFQFNVRDLSLLPGPRLARAELAASTSGWAIAAWFAKPNALLEGRRPVEMIGTDLSAVLDAARFARQAAKPPQPIEAGQNVGYRIPEVEAVGH